MALKIEVGDVFNEIADKDVVFVHGCNAQSVMGSGVAALVKKLYPHAYLAYKQVHRRHGLKLGQVIMVPSPIGTTGPIIANAITQEFYGRDGKLYASYDAIVVAMESIVKEVGPDKPIHLPLIGAGLGGLDPKRITAILQAVFHNSNAYLWLKEE